MVAANAKSRKTDVQILCQTSSSALPFACLHGLLAMVLGFIAVGQYREMDAPDTNLENSAYSSVGMGLGLLLVVRIANAYNTYHSHFQSLGSFLGSLRTIAIFSASVQEKNTMTVGKDFENRDVLQFKSDTASLLKMALAGFKNTTNTGSPDNHTEQYINTVKMPDFAATGANKCLVAIRYIGQKFNAQVDSQRLDATAAAVVSSEISASVKAYMALETATFVPEPMPFTQLVLLVQYGWVFSVPFALGYAMHDDYFYTPLCSFLLAMFYFGLHGVAEHMEGPLNCAIFSDAADAMCDEFKEELPSLMGHNTEITN